MGEDPVLVVMASVAAGAAVVPILVEVAGAGVDSWRVDAAVVAAPAG